MHPNAWKKITQPHASHFGQRGAYRTHGRGPHTLSGKAAGISARPRPTILLSRGLLEVVHPEQPTYTTTAMSMLARVHLFRGAARPPGRHPEGPCTSATWWPSELGAPRASWGQSALSGRAHRRTPVGLPCPHRRGRSARRAAPPADPSRSRIRAAFGGAPAA